MGDRADRATAELLVSRFVLGDVVGRGSCGEVLRAVDTTTGAEVAVKRMLPHLRDEAVEARFNREATLLARIRNPHVVKYLAHGIDAMGRSWLAQEWLDGVDLARRSLSGPLSVTQSLDLVFQAAIGLQALHESGIVHRDVKPANMFLVPKGDGYQLKLIDLGIALALGAPKLTTGGMRVGSPAYMSPEQAKGAVEVTGSSDIFSLGVVAFELLTGRRPFAAHDPFALLAKLVVQDAPSLLSVVPSAPLALARAVDRALFRSPRRRFSTAAEMATAFNALIDTVDVDLSRSSASSDGDERTQVVPVPALSGGDRLVTAVFVAFETEATVEADRATFVAIAESEGAIPEHTLGARSIALFGSQRSDGDEVERAARAAIRMRAAIARIRVAIATCRARIDDDGVASELIDAGADALAREGAGIPIDATTARLVESHFRVEGERDNAVLVSERAMDASEGASLVLGRPTPMVGREGPLAGLLSEWSRCVNDSQACATVVVGRPGSGKSRLTREVIKRVRETHPDAAVWLASGDPLGGMAALGVVEQITRAAIGIRDGDPIAERRVRVTTHVSERVPAANADRVAHFLGELVGAPFDDVASLQLRAARLDPMLMSDQIRRAFEEWVAGECARRPVIVVVEDLQWADVPSLELLGTAAANLRDRPLLLLGTTRPGGADAAAKMWPLGSVTTLVLADLSKRACESLARAVLGQAADPAVVGAIAERSAGNPFHLEELLRAVREGRGAALPDTILAGIQARLDALGPAEQSLVCIASVFGQSFCLDALLAVLGERAVRQSVTQWLDALCDAEFIVRRSMSRYAGQVEYAFRHALVRDAAYELLPQSERTAGHRRAAEWLERMGESDPLLMAEHWVRGNHRVRGASAYREAALHALARNDFGAVLACAEKAVECGASGVDLGEIEYLRAEAYRWRGEDARMADCAREAARLLPSGSARWHQASVQAASASYFAGDVEPLLAYVRVLIAAPFHAETAVYIAFACLQMYGLLRYAGHVVEAGQLIAYLDRLDREVPDALVQSWAQMARLKVGLFDGYVEDGLEEAEQSAALYMAMGDVRGALLRHSNRAGLLVESGAFEESEKLMRECIDQAQSMGAHRVVTLTKINLAAVRTVLGCPEEGLGLLREVIALLGRGGDRRAESYAHAYAARALLALNRTEEARDEVRAGLELSTATPAARALALGLLARVNLVCGNAVDALSDASAAIALLEASGGDTDEGITRWMYAEALYANQRFDEAREAIRAARNRLMVRASRIKSAKNRQCFLERVPEHAATLARADLWLGEH